MQHLTTAIMTTILVALPSLAQAVPSSIQRATSAVLDDGIAVSGVRFLRRDARDAEAPVGSATQLDREGNLPALWLGLKVQSGQHQYRLQLDAVRLAASALPAGRTIRAAASGAGAAWELLQPELRSQRPQVWTPPGLWHRGGPMVWWLNPEWPARLAPLPARQLDTDPFYEFLVNVQVPAESRTPLDPNP